MKGKKRISLFATLACAFALVFSLGLMSACGDADNKQAADGTWFYGTTVPADTLGAEGDYYFNTETLTAYAKTADGTWQKTTLYCGNEVPANDVGEEGALFLELGKGVLHQKGADGWKEVLTLKGKPGRDGVIWFSGPEDPTAVREDARLGDFYLNTTSFEVWQLVEEGNTLKWDSCGTLKGNSGKDASQFFNGTGEPNETNPVVKDAKEGDLYLGQFSGIDGEGGGSRLYRKQADGSWLVLMDTVKDTQIEIHNMEELIAFADAIETHDGYAGKEVHLKTDIYFKAENAGGKARAARAVDGWTPIGTNEVPFRGIFDGEGHTITNFKTAVSTEATEVGFFGNVEGATIQHLHFVDVTVDATVTESGSESQIGAVVVGQVQGEVTVRDVTVTGATVQAGENDNANVGGLVGKLESSTSSEETKLTVEGSKFEGKVESSAETPKSVDSLVADQSKKENVTITDSTVKDTETDTTTGWTESGNRYEEKTEESEGETTTERTYFASSAEDLESLLSTAEESAPLNVALDGDLDLTASTLTVEKNLTLDVGEHNLTVKSQGTNAGIQVKAGKNFTLKGAEKGKVFLDSATSSKPAISVSGSGATLDIQGANVEVRNTYDIDNSGSSSYKIDPAILAENGGRVNIGSGTTITAYGQDGNETSYKEPQVAAAKGSGSLVFVDGEDVLITLNNASGIYAQEGGKIDFRNGTINMTGGSCNVALGLGEGEESEIVFSGGVINITGKLEEGTHTRHSLDHFAIAIGSATYAPENCLIIVNGGTINLQNTGGSAIAVGADAWDSVRAFVGDGVVINVQATEEGKAYAIASGEYGSGLRGALYTDAIVNIGEATNNFKVPTSSIGEYFSGSGWLLYNTNMSEDTRTGYQYTKKAMGLA